jgi:hypothetical protein
MKRQMPNNPDELRERAAGLWEVILQGFTGGAFFPPIAGVAVEIGYGRFREMLRDGTAHNDDELFGLYALAHESIHLAQMITSRWFFTFVRNLTRRANWATHYESTGKAPPAGWSEEARRDFMVLNAGLTKVVDGFSAREVLETQAVIEGLWGAMPSPSAEKVVYAARQFYEPDSMYRHILDHMVKRFGAEAAVSLAPKLCAIALQSDEPGGVMSDMLSSLDGVKGGIDKLVRMSPADLLKSSRLDPHMVSRSCREVGPVSARDLGDLLFTTIASDYFDGYEALGEEARLAAMMHPGRLKEYTRADKPIFRPMYGLFGDGQYIDAQGSGRNTTDFAHWVDIGLYMRDGIAWLSEN